MLKRPGYSLHNQNDTKVLKQLSEMLIYRTNIKPKFVTRNGNKLKSYSTVTVSFFSYSFVF